MPDKAGKQKATYAFEEPKNKNVFELDDDDDIPDDGLTFNR